MTAALVDAADMGILTDESGVLSCRLVALGHWAVLPQLQPFVNGSFTADKRSCS
jgi:hypothetical protein